MRALVLCGALGFVCLPCLAADDIPRTPSGEPDFSGTYDISVLTPFERDPKHGTQRYMSAEEAREIERTVAAATALANNASDPDRGAPPSIGEEDFGGVGAYNRFWLDRGTTRFSIDGRYRTSILTDPADGRLPPLTEAGEKRRAQLPQFGYENTGTAWWLEAEEDPYAGPESLTLVNRCVFHQAATIPMGPRAYNNVKTITQTDDHIVLLVEWMHWARIIRLDSEHVAADIRSLAGDSIGRWEGDTLVVDTTNFLASPSVPREGLHVVERFRYLDRDTLLYEYTVEDPEYTAPYSGSLPWPRTDSRLYEFACHEGNYAVGNTLRGARFLEKEFLEQRGSAPALTAQTPQAELDSEFEELMNGASLIGQFTVDGINLPVQPESYSVSKVEKLDDGRWLFVASMKYFDNEITLPMPFKVVWSGDTPVITLTDEPIEGMEGSFSARVLIYDGLYAGTWKHDAFGGHMWGRIEKASADAADPAADSDRPSPEP